MGATILDLRLNVTASTSDLVQQIVQAVTLNGTIDVLVNDAADQEWSCRRANVGSWHRCGVLLLQGRSH